MIPIHDILSTPLTPRKSHGRHISPEIGAEGTKHNSSSGLSSPRDTSSSSGYEGLQSLADAAAARESQDRYNGSPASPAQLRTENLQLPPIQYMTSRPFTRTLSDPSAFTSQKRKEPIPSLEVADRAPQRQKRQNRPPYSEEQGYFIRFCRDDLCHTWETTAKLYNDYWHSDGFGQRQIPGLQSRYYRLLDIPVRDRKKIKSGVGRPELGVLATTDKRFWWMVGMMPDNEREPLKKRLEEHGSSSEESEGTVSRHSPANDDNNRTRDDELSDDSHDESSSSSDGDDCAPGHSEADARSILSISSSDDDFRRTRGHSAADVASIMSISSITNSTPSPRDSHRTTTPIQKDPIDTLPTHSVRGPIFGSTMSSLNDAPEYLHEEDEFNEKVVGQNVIKSVLARRQGTDEYEGDVSKITIMQALRTAKPGATRVERPIKFRSMKQRQQVDKLINRRGI